MAHIAIDIDGTAAAAPAQFQEIASALKACGHRVSILTGTSNKVATQQDFNEKANYLNALGMGQSYDDMTIFAHRTGEGIAAEKAKYCVEQGVDVMFDNSEANAQAAIEAGVPLVLVPWASRVKGKGQ